MKRGLIASLMIFVLVFSMFSVYLIKPVFADSKVCCEKTQPGEYCQYTDVANCDLSVRSNNLANTCENTQYCEIGCCYKEGSCFKNVGHARCNAIGGSWDSDENCNLPRCQKNCCVLGSECSYVTDEICSNLAEQYDVEKDFREVAAENECTAICTQAEKGCCVTEECSYVAMEECEGEFHDAYCSEVCEDCEMHDHKECVEGLDDVYWFDSCGNREEAAEDCDYGSGTICGTVNGEVKCRGLDCAETYDDPNVAWDGVARKNGESWCSYEGPTGGGNDYVGSRHYRNICVNGEETMEPCADYREEVCVYADINTPDGTYTEAACKENRWEDCATTCRTADYNAISEADDEDSAEEAEEEYKLAVKKDKKCCEDYAVRDCIWAGNEESGFCLPNVPPGLDLGYSEEAPGAHGGTVCSQGELKCTYIEKKGIFGGWKCKKNCECKEAEWLLSASKFCRSHGDCGAYYNYVGVYTDDGFSSNSPAKLTMETYEIDSGPGLYLGYLNIPQTKWEKISKPGLVMGIAGLVLGKLSVMKGLTAMSKTMGFLPKLGEVWAGLKGELLLGKTITDAGTLAANTAIPMGTAINPGSVFTVAKGATATFSAPGAAYTLAPGVYTLEGGALTASAGGSITPVAVTGLEAAAPTAVSSVSAASGSISGGAATAGSAAAGKSAAILGAAAWALVIIAAIIIIWMLLTKYRKKTITAYCSPWQPPVGGQDCNKCTDQDILDNLGFDTCSEYKCKSLGKLCDFIPENEGSGREACYNAHPNDVNSPMIKPWNEALTEGFSINELVYGYSISPILPAFTKITFGVETNELAQCKIEDKHTNSFEEMITFLGNNYYKNKHNMTMSLEGDKEYSYYVRCQDPSGNSNAREYLITFATEPGPDLTPPYIAGTSLDEGAYIQEGVDKVNIDIYLNEPAECRWDLIDADYDTMENLFACSGNQNEDQFYECGANLDVVDGAYYFRCEDNSGNKNEESYEFHLTTTEVLNIINTNPSGTLYENEITLEIITEGGAENGKAKCAFELQDKPFEEMTLFFETDSATHKQQLTLSTGNYYYYIRCKDIAGNEDNALIIFNIAVDTAAPGLDYMYQEDGRLYIVLNEDSNCEYSDGSFTFGEGTLMDGQDTKEHSLIIEEYQYYIRCRDLYGNEMGTIINP